MTLDERVVLYCVATAYIGNSLLKATARNPWYRNAVSWLIKYHPQDMRETLCWCLLSATAHDCLQAQGAVAKGFVDKDN